jgi:hypothetical protein
MCLFAIWGMETPLSVQLIVTETQLLTSLWLLDTERTLAQIQLP